VARYLLEDTRTWVDAGDPVRIVGQRGLYRLVTTWRGPHDGVLYADLVGPIGGAEGLRTCPASKLRTARRATRDDVAMRADVRRLSDMAKAGRR
jgi:hypothetical protein